ncbi:MAG: RibD family protein [Actinomycetota bacterium]|nr:RibD family protein [Actinomycetota bacterium]
MLINMVTSLDGKAAAGGKASPLGSVTDRMVMRNLRARVDAVMIGAGTLRAERLTLAVPEELAEAREARGLKPQPLGVVASTTGKVPLQTNLLGPPPDNFLILVPSGIPEESLAYLSGNVGVEILPESLSSGPGFDLKMALKILKEGHAVDVLLVEGGPFLNYALVSSGLVDEFFLTLTPKFLGGELSDTVTALEGPALSLESSVRPEMVSIHLSGDELFLRYVLN